MLFRATPFHFSAVLKPPRPSKDKVKVISPSVFKTGGCIDEPDIATIQFNIGAKKKLHIKPKQATHMIAGLAPATKTDASLA